MMRIIVFICGLFTCISIFAESFYISELFANKGGRHNQSLNFFMELHNISQHRILVSRVLLEISSGKEENIIREEITLKKALPFDDRLVLAQEPDLGLGLCLNSDITFILLPVFNLEKNKNHKICLTINNNERDCALFKDDYRSKNGAAVFRNYDGSKVQPYWLFESCHLLNNIFATPGYEPQACLTRDLAFSILVPCEEDGTSKNKIQEKALLLSEAMPPKITVPISGMIRIEDEDENDLWHFSQCVAPKDALHICHELEAPQSIKKEQDEHIKEFNWPAKLGSVLSYKVRDLYGLSDIIQAKENNAKRNINDLLVTSEKNNAQKLLIKLHLLSTDLPINYWVKDRKGHVIAAGAFIKDGEREVLVDLTDDGNLDLELQSLHENRSVLLNIGSHEGCQTGMSHMPLWMCVFLLVIKRLLRYFSFIYN